MSAAQSSLWAQTSTDQLQTAPLAASRQYDLVVIGGGFTGCAAALEAAAMGASVCLLEAETIGYGGSGRNVGLVNAGLWLPPDEIIAQMGEAAGTKLVELLGLAPDRVFDLITREAISCEATRAGTLHCAHSQAGFADLAERHRQGNRFGAPLQLLDKPEADARIGSDAFQGALWDPRAGTIQPLSYCLGLARAAMAKGAIIHETSPVSKIARKAKAWQVTSNGVDLQASALLVATNAYHLGIEAPLRPAFTPVHYSQFATIPMDAATRESILAGGEGCWDTAKVMTSFRVDRAGRMIIGGMGNVGGAGAAVHTAWARRKLRSLFPQIGELPFEHIWHGKIAMTSDYIPKILEFGPKAYACFGYSGRGIGPGTVFGTEAARALLSGDQTGLPIAPVTHHSERFSTLKGAVLELGATLTHAITR